MKRMAVLIKIISTRILLYLISFHKLCCGCGTVMAPLPRLHYLPKTSAVTNNRISFLYRYCRVKVKGDFVSNAPSGIRNFRNNFERHPLLHPPRARSLFLASIPPSSGNNSSRADRLHSSNSRNTSNIHSRTITTESQNTPIRMTLQQASLVNHQEDESTWSKYECLVRKLYQTNLFNPVKLGLENMNKLHKLLGYPMDQSNISVIHIAGSNGKGSVALKTANTFQRGNYKVGLFVSPHISSFRERIQINGVPISESCVEQYLEEIFDICERHCIPATFFEVTTALAFYVFAKEGVEVVVLETGLGGRLDATNVVRRPVLSVITSIGLEHTRILGDTIEKIALEKGGIIKEHCPVLVGNNCPWEVLQQCAKDKNASEIYRCEDVLGSVEDLNIDYDVENSKIASAAVILVQLNQAQQKSTRRSSIGVGDGQEVKLISADEIAEGVKIRPPCRFEEIDILSSTTSSIDGSQANENIRVILDVAHNPQAMDYLIAKLKTNYPNDTIRLVLGMSADKDLKDCTDKLLNYVSQNPERIHLVEASHPRAASIKSILESNPALAHSHYETKRQTFNSLNRDESLDERDDSSVSKQVREALQIAARNKEILVICGSVFIMADAREELGIIEPRDSAVIAKVAGAGMRSSQENFGSSQDG